MSNIQVFVVVVVIAVVVVVVVVVVFFVVVVVVILSSLLFSLKTFGSISISIENMTFQSVGEGN